MELTKGSDIYVGVPWCTAGSGVLCMAFAWQAWHLELRKDLTYDTLASLGVPWAPGLSISNLRTRLTKGLINTLVSPGTSSALGTGAAFEAHQGV